MHGFIAHLRMVWNARCSQKALGKSLFSYYSKVLAADNFNNWINIHIANASRFDSALYSSVADKLNSMKLILFQVNFWEMGERKASLSFADVRDPRAAGPNDFSSVVL